MCRGGQRPYFITLCVRCACHKIRCVCVYVYGCVCVDRVSVLLTAFSDFLQPIRLSGLNWLMKRTKRKDLVTLCRWFSVAYFIVRSEGQSLCCLTRKKMHIIDPVWTWMEKKNCCELLCPSIGNTMYMICVSDLPIPFCLSVITMNTSDNYGEGRTMIGERVDEQVYKSMIVRRQRQRQSVEAEQSLLTSM